MDKLIDKIVGLGVPGLLLLGAMNYVGWSGAAAITASLAMLGGPFGMLGGIAVMGLMLLISRGIAKYGFEKIFQASVSKMRSNAYSKEYIKNKIDAYWFISNDLKNKLKYNLDNG